MAVDRVAVAAADIAVGTVVDRAAGVVHLEQWHGYQQGVGRTNCKTAHPVCWVRCSGDRRFERIV